MRQPTEYIPSYIHTYLLITMIAVKFECKLVLFLKSATVTLLVQQHAAAFALNYHVGYKYSKNRGPSLARRTVRPLPIPPIQVTN